MPKNKNELSSVYRRYYDELRSFISSRLSCQEEAADVVQDAFVRVLALDEGYQVQHFRGFLYRTVQNLAIDRLRARAGHAVPMADVAACEECPAEQRDPEMTLHGQQRLRILQEAIADLPPKCRTVFVLHKFQGLSYSEIATTLGISKNMVEKHIIKALSHCRQRLSEPD